MKEGSCPYCLEKDSPLHECEHPCQFSMVYEEPKIFPENSREYKESENKQEEVEKTVGSQAGSKVIESNQMEVMFMLWRFS